MGWLLFLGYTNNDAGWSSLVARRAHNPKVVGSNPAPATNNKNRDLGSILSPCFISENRNTQHYTQHASRISGFQVLGDVSDIRKHNIAIIVNGSCTYNAYMQSNAGK